MTIEEAVEAGQKLLGKQFSGVSKSMFIVKGEIHTRCYLNGKNNCWVADTFDEALLSAMHDVVGVAV